MNCQDCAHAIVTYERHPYGSTTATEVITDCQNEEMTDEYFDSLLEDDNKECKLFKLFEEE